MDDGYGKIQVKGDVNNTVTFHRDIGEKTEINNGRYTDTVRIGEIDIETGKKTEFKQIVTAKKIKVAVNDVVFEDKLDMKQYNNNIVIGVGNLEFIDHGKVKFDKDFIGDIITSKANQGEATFVNTPDIFGIGAVNRRIETVIFTGNHNLHKDIHAEYIKFDAGTYNINNGNVLIDGTAHFNGSTLNLVHNLTFTGDVFIMVPKNWTTKMIE